MLYSDLVLSGKLYSYLADIDTQARNKLHLLITQLAEKEGINEQLKAQDQMAWVGAMNNIRNRAEEIILQELIYGRVPYVSTPKSKIPKRQKCSAGFHAGNPCAGQLSAGSSAGATGWTPALSRSRSR